MTADLVLLLLCTCLSGSDFILECLDAVFVLCHLRGGQAHQHVAVLHNKPTVILACTQDALLRLQGSRRSPLQPKFVYPEGAFATVTSQNLPCKERVGHCLAKRRFVKMKTSDINS